MAETHPNDIGLATFQDVGDVAKLKTAAKTVVAMQVARMATAIKIPIIFFIVYSLVFSASKTKSGSTLRIPMS